MNQQSIYEMKGIGEKTGKLYEKLGIRTLEDLLTYYPRAYDSYDEPVEICSCKPDAICTVRGVLVKNADIHTFNHLQVVTTVVKDSSGMLHLTWFNMPYLRTTLKAGSRAVFRGRVIKKKGQLLMEQPEVFTPENYSRVLHSMQPIYGQTKGLGNKAITRAVVQAMELRQMERDFLPMELRRKHELAEYNFALEHIHFPIDNQELLFAYKRLVFDEFFLFLLAVRRLKEKREDKVSGYRISLSLESERLKSNLPYALTAAQEKVLTELYQDLSSGRIMNRLIQGDVGSGKTILAVLALLQVADQGYQGALMVPTEVLAKQHYTFMTELFHANGIQKRLLLLTGSMTAREKREAYAKIEQHETDIIIGTHALIQEKVVYHDLALVITDEQHRFGVHQREAFGHKGLEPHILVMSATPIPRTLAVILYGDLDISIIDELPASRLPIKNCVVDTGYRKKAYPFIQNEVAAGRQAYVICPMVEESEMIEAENVLDYAKRIQKEMTASVKVGYLHGKMKSKEKIAVMEQFVANEIQVLVSTTVIEVGVDVPNATVIMIENAERFGLAQLHQLRGRVGRGKHQSYCILINSSDQEAAQERLNILNQSNDGFFIASEDLKLRGPGDIFGIRQSGELEFKLADIFTDADLLKTVSEEVNEMLEADPKLEMPGHKGIKERLSVYLKKSYEKLNL